MSNLIKASGPYIGMMIIQLAYGGSSILCKIALEQGLSYLVFIVYRHLIALAILAPLAYLLERKSRRLLSFQIVAKIFVLALFGVTIHQNVYYAGLDYTSPTVAGAMSNVIPAFTFTLALLLRMEKINTGNRAGRIKLLGTIICISGAFIFTFWRGHVLPGLTKKPLVDMQKTVKVKENWVRGALLILSSQTAYSAWLILQRMITDIYPAKLSINAMVCFFATIQSSLLALVFERNAAAWQLNWNIQLVTVLYCATVISCFSYYLQTYCIGERGPVFAAMFSPLLLIIVAIMSALIFSEKLHIGSLIGALIIIGGLCCVLWGKSKENKNEQINSSNTSIGTNSSNPTLSK